MQGFLISNKAAWGHNILVDGQFSFPREDYETIIDQEALRRRNAKPEGKKMQAVTSC